MITDETNAPFRIRTDQVYLVSLRKQVIFHKMSE